MRITLLTVGSRGDVEPFVALGEGLQRSGHTVTIATEAHFENFVKDWGLQFAPVPGDTTAALNSEAGHKALNKRNNTQAFFNNLTNAAAPFAEQILLQNITACKNAGHIITTPWCLHTGYFIAREMGASLSVAAGNATVLSNTREFHNLMFPPAPVWLPQGLLGKYHLFSHQIVTQGWWSTYQRIYRNAWKKAAGFTLPSKDPMPEFAKTRPLQLYGYSQYTLPKPADWDNNRCVTGYWLLKPNALWKPQPELEAFINAGPAPIYIGFGSMNNSLLKQGQLEKLIVETVVRTQRRAVVLKQGLDLDAQQLPENIFAIDPVPFDYLFPKMSLLVHHGGAGTTAIGLRSGVPAIITPLIVDQRFWASRVSKIIPAAQPIPWHDLTIDKLVDSINKISADETTRKQAKELGEKISNENGVENAVAIFNRSVFS